MEARESGCLQLESTPSIHSAAVQCLLICPEFGPTASLLVRRGRRLQMQAVETESKWSRFKAGTVKCSRHNFEYLNTCAEILVLNPEVLRFRRANSLPIRDCSPAA